MGQIISNFPESLIIVSDPCNPWEPDWHSISCVSCWFTRLFSCYLPYWVFLQKLKYKSECTFPSDGRTFQWLIRLAREFFSPATYLATRGDWNGTRERTDYNNKTIINMWRQFCCERVSNFLFKTNCGQWRSIVKELMFLFEHFMWWK